MQSNTKCAIHFQFSLFFFNAHSFYLRCFKRLQMNASNHSFVDFSSLEHIEISEQKSKRTKTKKKKKRKCYQWRQCISFSTWLQYQRKLETREKERRSDEKMLRTLSLCESSALAFFRCFKVIRSTQTQNLCWLPMSVEIDASANQMMMMMRKSMLWWKCFIPK